MIRLRRKLPDFPRSYRGPGNLRIGDYDAPLFAIVGGTFTAVAFVVIAALNLTVAAFGVGWLVFGIARLRRLPPPPRARPDLHATRSRSRSRSSTTRRSTTPCSCRSPSGYDEHVMATAAKLAARKRRGMHVVSFVTVPHSLPIDAPMREEEAAAQSVIEQARVQGGRRVSGHVERIRPGQAGRRIIEEAIDMRAAAIVLALPRRVDGASLFGKTLETVLAERPCRVVIESTPPAGAARPAPAGARARPGWRREGADAAHLVPAGASSASAIIVRTRRRRRRRGRLRDPGRPAVRGRRRRAAVPHARAARPRGAALMPRGPTQPIRRGMSAAGRIDTLPQLKRGLGSPALFGIVQGFIGASIYFSVGVVAAKALGLTWVVFLAGAVFFACSCPATSRAPRCTRSAAARR